jgi:hypothetical protein
MADISSWGHGPSQHRVPVENFPRTRRTAKQPQLSPPCQRRPLAQSHRDWTLLQLVADLQAAGVSPATQTALPKSLSSSTFNHSVYFATCSQHRHHSSVSRHSRCSYASLRLPCLWRSSKIGSDDASFGMQPSR